RAGAASAPGPLLAAAVDDAVGSRGMKVGGAPPAVVTTAVRALAVATGVRDGDIAPGLSGCLDKEAFYVSHFNDRHETTHADVLDLFDRAIATERRREQVAGLLDAAVNRGEQPAVQVAVQAELVS